MRLAGFLLLLAGWGIVLAAVRLFAHVPSGKAFVLAGAGVELLGLIIFIRSHLSSREESE